MNKTLKINILSYYLATILLVIAQSLPHAILTPLLLNKGLSLSQIMIIQATYSLCVLISEYPSGVLADLMNRKILFIVSKLILVCSFFCILWLDSFISMILAWGIYGLSNALESGTIDATLITNIKEQKEDLSTFIAKSHQISFIGLIVGSCLGSFLYLKYGVSMYYISVLLTLLCISVIILFFKDDSSHKLEKNKQFQILKQHVKESFRELRDKPLLKNLILLSLILQIFFQSHFQLWQAYLLNKQITENYLFIFYISFQVIGILIHLCNAKLYNRYITTIMIFLIGLASVLLLSTNILLFVSSYMLSVALFTYIDFIVNYQFSLYVSKEKISSLTSLKSSYSRVISVLILGITSLELLIFSPTIVITIHFMITLILTCVFLHKTKL
ncbi:MFS transporter [Helicobacter acinonychis]|uniref:MccC-like protein n=1 Tax=Helicobacter acinonychis (strain Sheeba) TaxID=382638 RepID=Q17XR8_HELAH|nr:MFS transporter [Helicobacter acinonychis]CAJ99558.1 MccC-like protein [Helicobacter acinonychis str. Sheeba]STP04125.1 MccC-like protein [Helicobacter acinonychis]